MKITKYGHAIILSVFGIFITGYNQPLFSLIGGILIGLGLRLARESGSENETN